MSAEEYKKKHINKNKIHRVPMYQLGYVLLPLRLYKWHIAV